MGAELKVVNLTPHALHYYASEQDELPTHSWPPSGDWARIPEQHQEAGTVEVAGQSVPVSQVAYGAGVTGLPDPEPGTIYVVSRVTAARVTGRDDVYFPFPEVRDSGNCSRCGAPNVVKGARGLARFDQ